MRLYLVQHGHAVAKSEHPERPLSKQGRDDIRRLAASLAAAGIQVQRIWHSGKLRALETAALLASHVSHAGKPEAIRGINPNDPVNEFATDADVWDEDTLVVGHLPFMSRLLSLLVTADPQAELVQFMPGSVVCLERVAAERWVINWMLRPDLHLADDDGAAK